MARDEIVEKLDRFLAGHQPIESEPAVVYWMVETRKIVAMDGHGAWPSIKFYADWTVHSRKDRVTPDMRAVIDQIYREVCEEIGLGDEAVHPRGAIRAFAYMTELRREMSEFLRHNQIADVLTQPKRSWTSFVGQLVKVLENQPIVAPTDDVTSMSFEPAAPGCVITRVMFNKPVGGYTHYDYKNAY
jgi:hypothetical protein